MECGVKQKQIPPGGKYLYERVVLRWLRVAVATRDRCRLGTLGGCLRLVVVAHKLTCEFFLGFRKQIHLFGCENLLEPLIVFSLYFSLFGF